jgi:hypothetical protein
MLSRKPKKKGKLGIIYNNNIKYFLKYGVRMWTGFIWLRTEYSNSSGEYGNQRSVSTECGSSNII